MDATGRLLEWLGLQVSLGDDMLKWSIVRSDMSTNSLSWIRLTNLFGTGGSPAPNDEADEVAIVRSRLPGAELLEDCQLLVLVCLPVSGSSLGDVSVTMGMWLMAADGGILERAMVGNY